MAKEQNITILTYGVERDHRELIESFIGALQDQGIALIWNDHEQIPGTVGFFGLDDDGKWGLVVDVHDGGYNYWSAGNTVIEGSLINNDAMRDYFSTHFKPIVDRLNAEGRLPHAQYVRLTNTILNTGGGYGFLSKNATGTWSIGLDAIDLSPIINSNNRFLITPRPDPREASSLNPADKENEPNSDNHAALVGKVYEYWVESLAYLLSQSRRGVPLTKDQGVFLSGRTMLVPPLRDTFRGANVPKLPCEDYFKRQYINGFGPSQVLYEKLFVGAHNMNDQLSGYFQKLNMKHPLVLRELSSSMPHSQFETINNGLSDPELHKYVKFVGFENAEHLAWNVATNPDYEIRLSQNTMVSLRILACSPDHELSALLGRDVFSIWKPLINFVKAAAVGYEPWQVVRYGHNGHTAITWREIDNHLWSLSGKCDLVAFADGGNDIARNALQVIQNHLGMDYSPQVCHLRLESVVPQVRQAWANFMFEFLMDENVKLATVDIKTILNGKNTNGGNEYYLYMAKYMLTLFRQWMVGLFRYSNDEEHREFVKTWMEGDGGNGQKQADYDQIVLDAMQRVSLAIAEMNFPILDKAGNISDRQLHSSNNKPTSKMIPLTIKDVVDKAFELLERRE